MRTLRFMLVAAFVSALAAACAAPRPGAMPEEHHRTHHKGQHHGFSTPEAYATRWNDPARDAWQKPEEIVAAMKIGEGMAVADLGAGTGYLLPSLSKAVGPQGQVMAIDVEPKMLEYINAAARNQGWHNVRTHLGEAGRPGLEPGSVDAMVTLNTWHHIEDQAAYARAVAEALKPGGCFVVVEFLPEDTEGWGPPKEMRLAPEAVHAALRAAGLTAVTAEETLPRHYIVVGVKK